MGQSSTRYLSDEADRLTYLDRLEHYRERYRCVVYAYVSMSNHVHLLIEAGAAGLSKIMQDRYPLPASSSFSSASALSEGAELRCQAFNSSQFPV